MKTLKKLRLNKISELETIEQKSFWIVAPTVAFIGLCGLATAGFYQSSLPTIISAILCLVIPLILMAVVKKKKNYHSAYPLLCIFIGAFSVPLTFIFSGGFLSGMPLFCIVATAVTALCYSTKWRIISLISCLLGNTIAFLYVYLTPNLPTMFMLVGTQVFHDAANVSGLHTIYNDILFGYYLTSIGLYAAIVFIINDYQRYKFNQDALQQFFDIEKRKEILKNALSDDTSKTEHKKAVIMFADISNFTPTTEKMSSDLISDYLKEFFSTAGKYIHETGGVIDKYIGDCIMAYWFDNENSNCVLDAVQAAINLKLDIFKRSEQINAKYGTELTFTVGIAYGDVIFGDIGSDSMHDYTVIGDAVNTASRVEHYAVSGEMLISDSAAMMIKDSVILEKVEDDHFFKGKNRAVDVYRIIGLTSDRQQSTLTVKESYGYNIHICGCRGSFPVSGIRFSEYGGETSCYVIRKGNYATIIDCGTGLKNAIDLLNGCDKVDILLTHVHYDHILGLLMTKFPQGTNVRIFGHFSGWNTEINTLKKFMEHPYWPVEIFDTDRIDIELGKEYDLCEDMKATFYLSDHPDEACVIKIMCKDKKVVFLADCENAESLDRSISEGSELLLYDGMFDDNDTVDHKGWGHGTWQSGVRFLNGKNIRKLVVTHHSPEMGDHSLMIRETEAREQAQNVSFAKSGDIFTI